MSKVHAFDLIGNIICNLISNAVKYSLPGGLVEVDVFHLKDKEASFLAIRDYGSGMESSTMKKITEKQFQGSIEGAHDEKGTGIGLALCQDLLERVGWRLEVVSTLGEGSIFRLFLPIQNTMMPSATLELSALE
ncbi:sensor histidine kinase [Sphingobacterium sp. LRF_L2]|uniref:sensor histidine kinase n=1 Tax=Sphingobacterium sp. LRF_L2 TaxID=3369421 RepID=UPI003F5E6386